MNVNDNKNDNQYIEISSGNVPEHNKQIIDEMNTLTIEKQKQAKASKAKNHNIHTNLERKSTRKKYIKNTTSQNNNNDNNNNNNSESKDSKINGDTQKNRTLNEDVMFRSLELQDDIKIILIKEAFRMFDSDESGYIDKKEFRKLIQSLGIEMNVTKIDSLMREVDKDGSGSIDIEEFTQMMLKYQFSSDIPITTHLDSAFNLYDKDDDGIISEEDLLKVALELDEELKAEEALTIINLAKTLMTEIDDTKINESEVVGFDKKEFINLLLKTKFLQDKSMDYKDDKSFGRNMGKKNVFNDNSKQNFNSSNTNKKSANLIILGSNTSFKNTSKESNTNKRSNSLSRSDDYDGKSKNEL
jgi:Ca2+-binding EF-hand superfamily protein